MTPGTLLANRYLLVSRIAAGGMGEVWRARDQLLAREVAVKVLRSHVSGDPTFRSRFRNEARITAGLADPGIAQVFDYGEQADLAFLVMELVQGEPLSAILARNGALGPEVALDVMNQTAKALHTAHSSGVIHRDIKPGNLMVTPDGKIKVTDFGIARALEAAPVTQTGTVLGTAQYVSPEQAQGTTLTPATDLYSLGVVAYECLAGRPPFQADTQVAIALMHLNEPPPPLGADVPRPVRELVMALLSKDPERRPGSAMELADRAYVLRDSLASLQQGTDLSMFTDPAGFRVREPYTGAGSAPQAYTGAGSAPQPGGVRQPYTGVSQQGAGGDVARGYSQPEGSDRTTDDLGGGAPLTTRQAPAARKGRRTVVLFATAASVAAVGFAAFMATKGQEPLPPPDVAEPTQASLNRPAEVKPRKSKSPTPRPPVVPVKSTRPVTSRSATVSSSATPSQKPTPKPTPTTTRTRTPTPTPTPTPTMTPTPTPTASPDPGDTNPPKEET
ncbi:serine/threonine-protein kinase [Nonomuraea sp. NPDC050790]|uniref:serine/threonine-protein kinase n=1 Tax=Nonomuraea sp. NPDC050790 TaxID=3364371 RepID=UPI0037B58BA8